MMIARLFAAALCLCAAAAPAIAESYLLPNGKYLTDRDRAAATSCLAWKRICDAREETVTSCQRRYSECEQTGCFADTMNFGGVNHCNLVTSSSANGSMQTIVPGSTGFTSPFSRSP